MSLSPYYPKLRRDLTFTVREETGEVIVGDPVLERYHSVGPLEYAVFQEFTGQASYEGVAKKVSREHTVDMSPDEVRALARQAALLGLLDLVSEGSMDTRLGVRAGRELFRRLKRKGFVLRSGRKGRIRGAVRARHEEASLIDTAVASARSGRVSEAARKLHEALRLAPHNDRARVLLSTLEESAVHVRRPAQGWMQFRIPLFNPERILPWLDRFVGFVVNPWNAAAAFLAATTALLFLLASWDEVVSESRALLDHRGHYLWLLVPLFFFERAAVLLHELSHGLTCQHFGGRVTKIGLLFSGVMVGAFCDVSAAYTFQKRWQRVAVALGGPVCDAWLTFWVVAGYLVTAPGSYLHVFLLALAVVKSVELVLSFLPFYKDDYYYALSEAFGVTNLLEKAQEGIKAFLARTLLGLPAPEPEMEPGERRVVYLYGTFNLLLTAFIVVKTLWIAFRIAAENFRGLGVVVFLAAIAGVLGRRVLRFLLFLWRVRGPALASARFRRNGGFAALGLMVLPFLPTSEDLVVDCQVVQETVSEAARTPGRIATLEVQLGDRVDAGSVLATLENPVLTQKRRRCESDLAISRAEYAQATLPARDVELLPLREQVAGAERDVAFRRAALARAVRWQRSRAVSTSEVASAETALKLAQAKLDADRLALKTLEAGARPEEREALAARLSGVTARCEALREEESRLAVVATQSGKVLSRAGGAVGSPVGLSLAPGDEVALVGLDRPPRAELELESYDVEAWAAIGKPLEVRLAGMATQRLRATVEQISPRARGHRVLVSARLETAVAGSPHRAACKARFRTGLEPLYRHLWRPVKPMFDVGFWTLW